MIERIDRSDSEVLKELDRLLKASYQVEADLIGFAGIPPLLETIEELKQCGEEFYGYRDKGRLAGIISVTNEGDECTICRLAVQPDFFRKGIGSKLIGFVITKLPYETYKVSTGKDNAPARTLYEKHRFQHTGDQELTEAGIIISHYTFEKIR